MQLQLLENRNIRHLAFPSSTMEVTLINEVRHYTTQSGL